MFERNSFKKALSLLLVTLLVFSCTYLIPVNVMADTQENITDNAVINYATEIGDCDSSGEVNIIDLVRLKKFLTNITSVDETLSDIKCDANINAEDLAALRKVLLGIDVSDIAYPRIEKTKYNTTEIIVADANVRYFGAVGDGETDDTAAFVNAMQSLGESGGTVYVPAGRYKLSNGFIIPQNVTLQGDFADPKLYGAGEVKNGSRLELYSKTAPQGNTTAFFRMRKYATLRGFMIWYPEQHLDNNGAPTEYPYTIDLVDWQSTNLRDLYLVNSYKAINDTANKHNLETLQNIYMTALYRGIEMQYNNDIGRFENINIGTQWWLESGLAHNIPEESALRSWTRNNTDGLRIYSIDNIFASDITVNDCKTALYTRSGYGKFYNFVANNCDVGVDVQAGQIYGYTFTNGEINAQTAAVVTASGTASPLAFYNVDMSSNGENVIKNASDVGVALTNCNLSLLGDLGEYAINCENGYVTATECGIELTNPAACCAYISSNASQSSFVNCNTEDTFDYTAESQDNVLVSFSSDKIVDFDTDFSNYERQSKKPQRQMIYNALDYGIDITETEDVSDTVQNIIDIAAASGGGIVYLPSYDYILQKPITVRSGVELRGSADRPHFGTAVNTTLVTDYGKNDENGTALITLENNSGLRGLTVDYSETRADGTPYAYTIRGNGENIYVVNCTVDSAWQVADFMTNKCDNHYIEAVNFGTLKTGIAVGGGSANGVVRDCQSNPTANRDSRNTVRDEWYDEDGNCLSTAWTLNNVTGYIVDNATNELHFMNFIYGCVTGLSVTSNSNLTAIGHGTDQANYGIYIADTSNVDIVSTELPIKKGTESYGIYLNDEYSGKTNVAGAEIWAVGESGYYCGGGELNVYGSIMAEGGKTAMQVAAGKAKMTSSMITRLGSDNYKVQKNAEGLEVYGNMTLTNNKAVLHTSSSLSGSDVNKLDISTVSTESKDNIVFWNDTLKKYTNVLSGWDYRLIDGKSGSDNDGGYLYSTLDENTNPVISFRMNKAVDASKMRYIEFDFYIPDNTLFTNCKTMQLELSSSTSADTNEIWYSLNCFKNGMLKSGWNHIKLDLERYNGSIGSIDFSAVKRLRMYYLMNTAVTGEMRIKNIYFSPSDYPEEALYFSNYSSSSGWNTSVATSVSCHSANDAYYSVGSPITFVRSSVDISDMDYLSMDIYISDAEIFNKAASKAAIEITSSTIWDKEEISYGIYSFKDVLSTGWNRITIPLSVFNRVSTTDQNFDPTAANFFRIYTNSSELGIAVGNLVFGKY